MKGQGELTEKPGWFFGAEVLENQKGLVTCRVHFNANLHNETWHWMDLAPGDFSSAIFRMYEIPDSNMSVSYIQQGYFCTSLASYLWHGAGTVGTQRKMIWLVSQHDQQLKWSSPVRFFRILSFFWCGEVRLDPWVGKTQEVKLPVLMGSSAHVTVTIYI